MELTNKLIALRKQRGWSQEELAEKLDISRQSVSKWESGASLPELDKIVKLSALYGVTTDYLLQDELPAVEAQSAPSARAVSLDDANAYLACVTRVRRKIALGVALCICSPAPLITLCGCTGEVSHPLPLTVSENMAAGVGVVALLLLVALGLLLLIPAAFALHPYQYLEETTFTLLPDANRFARDAISDAAPAFRRGITWGTVLCVLSVVPLMLSIAFSAQEAMHLYCVSLLLILVAVAVSVFIHVGMPHGACQKLLQTGEYTAASKEAKSRTAWFSGFYWCSVTAIYLAVSFCTGRWNLTWLIWAVGGVLVAALNSLVQHLSERNG